MIVVTEMLTEMLADSGAQLLTDSGRRVVADETLWREPAQLRGLLSEAEALIVGNQPRVDAELLQAAPQLRVIGRLGVGLDNIDLAAARERGIAVTAGRNANAIAVTEYVLAAMLHVARELTAADVSVRAGEWDRTRFGGHELWGKTLGLVGAGEIGRRVAQRARAFDMVVVAHDPLVGPYDVGPPEQGVALLQLEEVLARADYVSLHVPLLAATRHLMNRETLARMRPGAVLINTSRGAIVDEAALREALDGGRPRFAVLDVREQEPPGPDDVLRGHRGVLLTPHIAGLTAEAQERIAWLVVGDVLRVLDGERAIGAV